MQQLEYDMFEADNFPAHLVDFKNYYVKKHSINATLITIVCLAQIFCAIVGFSLM